MTARSMLAACAGMMLALAGAAPGPAVAAPADDVSVFLKSLFDGCMRTPRGHGYLWRHAFCLCSASQFRTVLDEPELEDLAGRAQRGEAIADLEQFREVIRERAECTHVGIHDERPIRDGYPDSELDPASVVEGFSIALPDGFIYLTRQRTGPRTSHAFIRFHADLQTATALQIAVEDDTEPAGAGRSERALVTLLDELSGSRTGWSAGPVAAVRIGDLEFKRAHWSANEGSAPVRGIAYAAAAPRGIVLIRMQDLERFADRTLPLMEASVRTFRLR